MPTRPPSPAPHAADPGDWFFTQAWRRSVLPLDVPRARTERPILVLGSDSPLSAGLVEALRAEGRPVLLALAGETCMRGGPEWFVVRPGEPGDLDALIDTLLAEGRLPADIAHCWTLAPDEAQAGPAARFARVRDRAYTSLLTLARALGRRGLGPRVCVHVLSNGIQEVAGEGVLSPLAALLLGPCRVAPREFPGLRLRSLDLHVAGETDGLAPELARRLLAELVAEAPDDVVAFRGRERLVAHFAPLRLAERPGGASWLRERGVYVVAGGLGGVGLAVAEHLARRVRARLVLLARRALPPRDAWGEWIAQHGEFEPTSRRLRRVQALEALGAEVMPLAADLSDPEALERALSEARARFGAIHGVFLAAGARDESAIRWKSGGSVEPALTTKVLGALALEAALGDAQPDFMLLHSSLAGAVGLPGQVDAAAADAFLAAFAAARSAAGHTSVCVSWGAWRDAGVAAERERAIEEAQRSGPVRRLPHPVLRRSLGAVLGEEVLLGELAADTDWWLAEHRTRGGVALLPGAAYAELACAAHAAFAGEGPLEIRDLRLREPLALAEGERCALRVRLGRTSGDLAIESRPANGTASSWVLHAEGRVLPAAGAAPLRPLAEIRRQCSAQRLRLEGPLPHAHLALGPRFACLRAVGYGEGELLAELALAETFAGEVAQHGLHAALVEMATGCALALLPEYNPVRDFYLPTAYSRIRVWQALPARVVCHVRHRRLPDERPGAAFDATFFDDDGRELAAIEALSFAAIEDPAALPRAGNAQATARSAAEGGALHVQEGLASLERLLSHEPPAHLLVCPRPIEAGLGALAGRAAAPDAAGPPPLSDAERALWELAGAGLESAA